MKNFYIAAVLLSLFFTSCKKTETLKSDVLISGEKISDSTTVSNLNKNDVEDTVATKKIREWYMKQLTKSNLEMNEKEFRNFQYDTFDFNADGKLEYLTMASISYFCGSGGCMLFVLDSNFKEIQEFSISSTPILALSTKTNGWNDLIIHSNNATAEDNNHVMKFNGKKYPSNPSTQEGLTDKQLPKNFVKNFFSSAQGAKKHPLEL